MRAQTLSGIPDDGVVEIVSVQVGEGIHTVTAAYVVALMFKYRTADGDEEVMHVALPAEMAEDLAEQLQHFADMVGGQDGI